MAEITPCVWKHGKRWVYTVTYDEALAELCEHVIPLHEQLSIPGHVEVVVGHMGKVRQIGNSSYNGYHHMDARQLQHLVDLGWGVGSHSWSHGMVEDDLEVEVCLAKTVLEEAIGCRVVTYTAPGSNVNITPKIVEALRGAGYLCALGITDDVNRPDSDLWFLSRSSNLHRGFEPLFSAFEPYHRLAQAQAQCGWVVDYCHCPAPKIPHEQKDVYLHEHRARLEAVLQTGGEQVWLATVEEVVDYILCRRAAQIERLPDVAGRPSFRLSLQAVPAPVSCHTVTFDVHVPTSLSRCPTLTVNDRPQPALLVAPGWARVSLDLTEPAVVILGGSRQ